MFDLIYKKKKIIIMILIGVVGLSSVYLNEYRKMMLEERKEEVRHHVQNGFELFHYYHEKVLLGELTELQARDYAIESIRMMSPKNNNYYWITNDNNKMVANIILSFCAFTFFHAFPIIDL